MSTLLSVVGFVAQFCVIASFVAIVISSVCLRTNDSVFVSEDHPSGAEPLCNASDSDASLFCASSYCAKSMVSASYTTTIDKPVSIAEDLGSLTIRQLKALCRERGIKHYSYLRKAELIALLSEF